MRSVPIVTSCSNRRTIGNGVFCAVRAEAIHIYNKDQLPLRNNFEQVNVRWPPACEDVSPEAEDRPLLEEVTKQCSEDRDWEH
jgi:hypothetical protein